MTKEVDHLLGSLDNKCIRNRNYENQSCITINTNACLIKNCTCISITMCLSKMLCHDYKKKTLTSLRFEVKDINDIAVRAKAVFMRAVGIKTRTTSFQSAGKWSNL